MNPKEKLAYYRLNPSAFVEQILKAKLEDWQKEEIDALTEEDRISVRSGHGVGKTTWLSWIILWFMSTRYPCKVGVTAPTSHQLEDALVAELTFWLRRMPKAWRDNFDMKDGRMVVTDGKKKTDAFCTFKTARKEQPEALQGLHSQHMLFIIDEASGVHEVIFEVAEGSLSTPGAKVVMTGNPTRTSGYFYDSHHRMKHRWRTRRVSCMDSTQVDEAYIEDMKLKYGEESNVYRVRVLGEFPLSDEDCVIPLHLVESAAIREVEPLLTKMPVWGLDVARYGKCKTALVKRWGNQVLQVDKIANRDTMEVAGWVMHQFEETEYDMRPANICVDSIGLGAGVADRLLELGLPVVAVNVGEAPSGRGQYANYRAELWWLAREWLEERDTSLTDEELAAELTCVTYKYTSTGKIQIESKHEMMERGVASPDLADAFCLTFAGAERRRDHDKYKRRRGPVNNEAWAA